MAKWECKKLPLKLNVNWKIARGATSEKENLIIKYSEGDFIGLGEVAFTTAMGLSADETLELFEDFAQSLPKHINGLEEMMNLLHEEELPSNLCFGIESAYIHFLSRLMEDTPQRVLGIRDVSNVPTSHSIPVMDVKDIAPFIENRKLQRFGAIKIKVSGVKDSDLVLAVAENYKGPLRIDGNEGFESAEEVLEFIEICKGIDIDFLEQPISHLNFSECIKLKEKSLIPIVGDEVLQDGEVYPDLVKAYHGVNVKLMKAGGYLKALKQLREAKALGLKTMIGCMVETSLGISSAMNIAHFGDVFDLDGFLFLEKDPYQFVYEDKGRLFYGHNH